MGVLAEVGVNFWVCMEWNSGVGIKFLLFFLGGGGSVRGKLCRVDEVEKQVCSIFFRRPQSQVCFFFFGTHKVRAFIILSPEPGFDYGRLYCTCR